MTSERVLVTLSEVEVGDLIEAEKTHDSGDAEILRGVVTSASSSYVETTEFWFDDTYTFYRLPKPAPEEPKGLGAVVEDNEGDLWIRTNNRVAAWTLEDTHSDWEMLLDNYGPVTVKSDGYIA